MPQLPNWDDDLVPAWDDLQPLQSEEPFSQQPFSAGQALRAGVGGAASTVGDLFQGLWGLAKSLPQLASQGPIQGTGNQAADTMLPTVGMPNVIANLVKAWTQGTNQSVQKQLERMQTSENPLEQVVNVAGLMGAPVGAEGLVDKGYAMKRAAAQGDWESVFRLVGSGGTEAAMMYPAGGSGKAATAAGPLDDALKLMRPGTTRARRIPTQSTSILAGEGVDVTARAAHLSKFEDAIREMPLTMAEGAGSPGLLTGASNIVEMSAPAKAAFGKVRSAQQESLRKAADALADSITERPMRGPYELGRGISDDISKAEQILHGRTDDLYTAWRQEYGTVKVSLKASRVQKQMLQLRKDLEKLERWIPQENSAPLKRVLDSFGDAGMRPRNAAGQVLGSTPWVIDLDTLHQVRSIMGKAIRKAEEAGVTGFGGGARKKGFGAIDELMETALRQADSTVPVATPPGAPGRMTMTPPKRPLGSESKGFDMYRAAADSQKEMSGIFRDRTMKAIIRKRPEKLYAMLDTMSVDDLQTVRRLVSPKVWADTQKRKLAEMIEQATQDASGLDNTLMAPEVAQSMGLDSGVGRTLSAKALDVKTNKLGLEKMQAMYNDSTLRGLQTLTRAAQVVKGPATGGVVSAIINARVIGPIVAATAGLAVGAGPGFSALLAGAASTSLAVSTMARVLATDTGRNAFMQAARATKAGVQLGVTRGVPGAVTRTTATNFQQLFEEEMRKEMANPMFEHDPEMVAFWKRILDPDSRAGKFPGATR